MRLEKIEGIELLTFEEKKNIKGGETEFGNWLVDKVGYAVGYAGEIINKGVKGFLDQKPNPGSAPYLH